MLHTMPLRVSFITLSNFCTHKIWQVAIYIILYHTLHPLHLQYLQHMTGDNPLHALSQYHAPHPPFSTHTKYDMWRSTPCSITHCTFYIFSTYSIWQATFHTMHYLSIMHQTLHFPHTQHMTCDGLHRALSHTAHLHVPYTQNMAGDAPHCTLLHTALSTSSVLIAYDRWRSTPCSIRVSCTKPFIFHTHNIWQMTLHTMLYKSIMHHILYFPNTQHMAAHAPHHALWKYHAPHPPFSTHTAYFRWC